MEAKDNMPKVSVIVPIFNVEMYLRECVDSILAQTFTDYELILVDDGSPDQCGCICDEYAEKDSRIRVIHKTNGGLSDARNAGLNVACGKYIYFMDSDDVISSDLLEKAVFAMDENRDMVVFKLDCFYPDGHTECGNEMLGENYVMQTDEERLAFIHQKLLPCKIGWEACTRVFRRDIIEQYGLRFADNRKIFAEDLYFTLCYSAHISSVSCLNEALYHYRLRDDSIMGVQKRKNNIGRINELGKAVLAHYQSFDDCSLLVEQYHLIHAQIVLQQFINQLWTSGIEPIEFQKMTRENVDDWEFLEENIKKAMSQQDLKHQLGSIKRTWELRSHADFLFFGSWNVLRIRCKLLRLLEPLIRK